MPELIPTGAVDVVERQVRRVRRRKNFYELQRALYLTIAAGAGAATLLLPLALFAPARLFAVAASSAVVVLAGIALLLAGGTRRRWLARRVAVPWIEARGALAGRLRTLIELGARPSNARSAAKRPASRPDGVADPSTYRADTWSGSAPCGPGPGRFSRRTHYSDGLLGARPIDAPETRFFFPLLVAEVGRDLDRWAPRRLIRRGIPRAAGATAVLTTAVLALALRFASGLVPSVPQVVFGGTPSGAFSGTPADAAMAGQLVVAPSATDDGGDGRSPAASAPAADASTLARLSSELQENVRRQVWGKAWERVRETLARAGEHPGSGTPATPGDDAERTSEDDPGEEWEIARAPSGSLTRRRRPGIGHQPAAPTDGAGAADSTDRPAPPDASETVGESAGEGGAGAGSGTAPALFGAPSDDDGPANGSFELSLAARMRAFRATDRRAGGTAPPADPDARPELGADQRRETAAHRMAVPAAYETVVREVFAHRRVEPDHP